MVERDVMRSGSGDYYRAELWSFRARRLFTPFGNEINGTGERSDQDSLIRAVGSNMYVQLLVL